MTDQQERAISEAEITIISTIISASNVDDQSCLLQNIHNARVHEQTDWILDISNPDNSLRSSLPNGPLPTRTYVPNAAEYRGEIIVWIEDGQISGLEYAWITDEPPSRWPQPDEIQIVNE